jgi:hypothetical protein
VGAVTWGNGTTGVSGVVSSANSLVGVAESDVVGYSGVTALSNGNYVVSSPFWSNGSISGAGAATWGSGVSGVAGPVSSANSLVGSQASDNVGASVAALSNGNYLVASPNWDNGGATDAGAATLCNGAAGTVGIVSSANSLVGTSSGDRIGNGGKALTNGSYVIVSPFWHNGASANAGAVTWCSSTTGVTGAVSAANSLVGSSADDQIGSGTVTPLSNGNYVVASPAWDNGANADAGAATWGNGTTGTSGIVSAANSLVGSTAGDRVAQNVVVALSNGNYVVRSIFWDNGGIVDAGAVTWGNGATGVNGAVSVANSLAGSSLNDNLGVGGVVALSNGNYVVSSPNWNSGGITDAGAATWGSGTTGVSGAVSVANSLVGALALDQVGGHGTTALTNGNYVVSSPICDIGGIADAGAATWGNGATGTTGVVSAANSLVGAKSSDQVSDGSITALSNGNYVVCSAQWDNLAVANVGAATWGNGAIGTTGPVSAANSLVGSTAFDGVGSYGVTALSNGNYVVRSATWMNGTLGGAGAVTWGNGTTGVSGAVSAANSLVGSTANDFLGYPSVTALANGDYVVVSNTWDKGPIVDAGAATWGSGTAGVSGAVTLGNSLVGAAANSQLSDVVEDGINGTFYARFANEGSGHVRVGPPDYPPIVASLVDIPSDQGGWLRMTFNHSSLDAASSLIPVATYAVWRRVPGTLATGSAETRGTSARPDATASSRLRSAIPPGVDVREVEGRFYATGRESWMPGLASVFPAGTWELVASVPSLQHSQYVVAVPTISNAAANDFVVSAHTTTPSIWYVSNPSSGQSVDNLAPSTPNLLAGSYSGGQTNLTWAPNSENDIGSYRVYRGTSAGFAPGPGNLIATVPVPGHSDPGPAGRYYKVSAVDVNGNESGFALLTPDGTADVAEEGPVAFALEGVRPNPANGRSLRVAFALPHRAAARLELLDVSGRRVVAREVGSLGAGRHTVDLAEGHRFAPGLYWVRLEQEANRRMTRVAVIE